MIEYSFVAWLKAGMWFVFAFRGLIVFMVYWAIKYPEPFETSKMEFFLKEVTLKEMTFLKVM